MNEKDLKMLWGRAAHRCSICRLELTAAGSAETIGEMAHIVARSESGPRGRSSMPRKERDKYPNLIPLCANHHTEIDKVLEEWSVDRLHEVKKGHEQWVTEQLSAGSLSIPIMSNTNYLAGRVDSWRAQYGKNSFVALSLTPLEIVEDVVDPVNQPTAALMIDVPVIGSNTGTRTQEHLVCPDSEGLRVVSRDQIEEGWRFHLLITRTGHCEVVVELQTDQNQTATRIKGHLTHLNTPDAVIRYPLLHAALYKGLDWLVKVYTSVLPFNDMTFSCLLAGVRGSNLLTQSGNETILGKENSAEDVRFSTILSRDANQDEVLHNVLSRLCQAYGMVLPDDLGPRDDPATPSIFSATS